MKGFSCWYIHDLSFNGQCFSCISYEIGSTNRGPLWYATTAIILSGWDGILTLSEVRTAVIEFEWRVPIFQLIRSNLYHRYFAAQDEAKGEKLSNSSLMMVGLNVCSKSLVRALYAVAARLRNPRPDDCSNPTS